MTDLKSEAAQALMHFMTRQTTVVIQPATVTAVDEGELTCDVTGLDDLELFDVRLRAALDGEDTGVVVIPAIGSQVLIGNIGNSSNGLVVLATTEAQKVLVKVAGAALTLEGGTVLIEKGTSKVEVATDGILIESSTQTLKAAIDALIDQIKLITVTCAAPGAPSTPPLNFAVFDVIKLQIAQILK